MNDIIDTDTGTVEVEGKELDQCLEYLSILEDYLPDATRNANVIEVNRVNEAHLYRLAKIQQWRAIAYASVEDADTMECEILKSSSPSPVLENICVGGDLDEVE